MSAEQTSAAAHINVAMRTADLKHTKDLSVDADIFAVPYNEALIHQVVNAYLAGGRAGTVGQKTRSEVRGGGKKPWAQKGTGRARAGSIRSPLWRKGCVTFAARTQDFSQKVNRKMYRGALRSIFSELLRKERLSVVETLTLPTHKTKDFAQMLVQQGWKDILFVTDEFDENLFLAARNLPKVRVILPEFIDPVSLIAYEHVVITQRALKMIEESLV